MNATVAHALRRWWRRARTPMAPAIGDEASVAFQCNLCGASNRVAPQGIGREIPSCRQCGSTVRSRSVVHLVCQALLGRDVAVPDLARAPHLRGVGLSDDAAVANALGHAFDYTNTYFHREPRLDITALPERMLGRYDFVTSSDVFEHVVPPVETAFVNARRLLRPGGTLVLTVPFSLEPDTCEHFPDLHEFTLEQRDGRWVLENRTRNGTHETFAELVFHGGPGTTLEMRLFSRAALERHLAHAGFRAWRFADEPCPRFGIAWPQPWSLPIVARA